MPIFKTMDRVCLRRRTKGLAYGTVGTVAHIYRRPDRMRSPSTESFPEHEDIVVVVDWDVVTEGSSRREHLPRSLFHEGVVADVNSPIVPAKEVNAFSKKLSLLGLDTAPTGLGAVVTFADTLKGIAEASSTLSTLRNSLRNVALYKGPEMNLYMAIKGKDVVFAKEVDGDIVESITIPLPIYTGLVESFRSGF